MAGIAAGAALLLVLAVGMLAWARQSRFGGERVRARRLPAVRLPSISAASRRLAHAPRPAFAAAGRAAAVAGGSARSARESTRRAGRALERRRAATVGTVRRLRPAPRAQAATQAHEPKQPAAATASDGGAPRPDVVGELLGTLGPLRAHVRAAEAGPDPAARSSQPRVAPKPPSSKPLDGGRVGVDALKAKQTRHTPVEKSALEARDDVTLLKTKLAPDTAPGGAEAEGLKAKLEAPGPGTEEPTSAEARLPAAHERPVVTPVEPPPAEEDAAVATPPACRITLRRGHVNSRFYALVETERGEERVIAESPEFRWRKPDSPPRDRPDIEAAHRALVGRLEREGWAPAGEAGQWFELRLRRQAPPEVLPPSDSPPSVEALLLLALGRRR